jgi:molybdenum cofactor synthesis domain-containing protein
VTVGAPRTAALLVIGNEILSGKVQDANVIVLSVMLRRLGISFRRVVVVLDEIPTIAAEVRALSESHDVVFTSGGVGPTHDDVTMDGVASAFGVDVVMDPDMEAMLRTHYGERLKDGHLLMARVPRGSVQRSTDEVRWPVTQMKNVWVLPGIPEIFRMKLSIIEPLLGADEPYLSRAVFTNLDEGTLKPLIDAVVAAYPAVDVGSYPTWGNASYKTKITFDGKKSDELEAASARFLASLPPGEPQRVE